MDDYLTCPQCKLKGKRNQLRYRPDIPDENVEDIELNNDEYRCPECGYHIYIDPYDFSDEYDGEY